MKVVIIMGSASDESHAKKITDNLDNLNISWEQFVASAHKQPLEVLKILEDNANEESLVTSQSPVDPTRLRFRWSKLRIPHNCLSPIHR